MAGGLGGFFERRNSTDAIAQMARRSDATGTFVSATSIPYSFQRTLVTRSNADQAVVTGLTTVLAHTAASTFQTSIQALARLAVGPPTSAEAARRWSRLTVLADLVAVGAGMAAQAALKQRPGEPIPRAAGRTVAWLATLTGVSGAVVGAVDEVGAARSGGRPAHPTLATMAIAGGIAGFRELDRHNKEKLDRGTALEPDATSTLRSLAMAGGVAVGASAASKVEGRLADGIAAAAASVLPGDASVWRPVGHAATLAAIAMGARGLVHKVFHRIEGSETSFEPALDVAPIDETVSGGPGSLVPYDTLAKMGRRFVWTLRRGPEIEEVLGRPATAEPIRVYVGLPSAATEQERIDLAIAELERTGAFDRSWLMVMSPTGTGYANYAAAGAIEFLSAGDCATVAMQYSARPSPLSLDRVGEGRSQVRALLGAIHDRLSTRATRPTVVLFGESLGAWTSQDAFMGEGTKGLDDKGIDHAIWIGTPGESKWKDQVLSDASPEIDRSAIGVFNDIGEWNALDDEAKAGIRFVMITHNNDGVARFTADLLVQSPPWLGPPESRPVGVPRAQRWAPITGFVQTLIDMKNAARVVPGQFAAMGHDYRADLVPFFDSLLGFGVGDEMVGRIVGALEREEMRRVNWINANKSVGGGMAVAILAKVRERDPEAFRAALEAVGGDIRATAPIGDPPTDAPPTGADQVAGS